MKSSFPASIFAASVFTLSSAAQAPETPPAQQPAPSPGATRQITKTLPNIPDDPANGWSIGAFYWLTRGPSDLLPGKISSDPNAQRLKLPDADKRALGVRITTPAGKYNRLEISGFEARGSTTTVASRDLEFFGQNFPKDDILQTSYRVRDVKVSWNYLTYPAPPTSAFRFKTLWEVQYVSARSTISAPLDENVLGSQGTRSIFLPTFGVGFDVVPNSNFRFEVKGSGFGLPGKSLILDGEANFAVRVKVIEVVGGGKYFRYRTTPNKKDVFIQGTLYGPYLGIRWVFGK